MRQTPAGNLGRKTSNAYTLSQREASVLCTVLPLLPAWPGVAKQEA